MNHRVLEHRARAVVALLLACLAALTLAACGSDDDKGGSSGGGGDTADARTLLRETFTGTKDVRSGRFTLALRAGEDGGDADIGQTRRPVRDAVGDDAYPKFDITADVDAGGDQISAGMVSTSDRLFVEFEDNAYEIPAAVPRDGEKTDRHRGQNDPGAAGHRPAELGHRPEDRRRRGGRRHRDDPHQRRRRRRRADGLDRQSAGRDRQTGPLVGDRRPGPQLDPRRRAHPDRELGQRPESRHLDRQGRQDDPQVRAQHRRRAGRAAEAARCRSASSCPTSTRRRRSRRRRTSDRSTSCSPASAACSAPRASAAPPAAARPPRRPTRSSDYQRCLMDANGDVQKGPGVRGAADEMTRLTH